MALLLAGFQMSEQGQHSSKGAGRSCTGVLLHIQGNLIWLDPLQSHGARCIDLPYV